MSGWGYMFETTGSIHDAADRLGDAAAECHRALDDGPLSSNGDRPGHDGHGTSRRWQRMTATGACVMALLFEVPITRACWAFRSSFWRSIRLIRGSSRSVAGIKRVSPGTG